LSAMQSGASRVLAAGGAGSIEGGPALRQLEEDMLALHVSPGGAADLLAATLFLDRLDQGFVS
jgi:triphosphoribosyl-dephospho-CoA synthase